MDDAKDKDRDKTENVQEISCRCLNIRVDVMTSDGSSDCTLAAMDDAGGPGLTVVYPSFVTEVSPSGPGSRSRSSSNKRSEDGQAAGQSDINAVKTQLRCTICNTSILSYDAADDSQPLHPCSLDGHFTIVSEQAIKGKDAIQAIRNDKDTYSDLFGIVVIAGLNSKSPELASEEPVSPTLNRSDSRDLQASAMGTSTFHAKARGRIKKDKQELEAEIIRMRAQHDSNTRRYLREADVLAGKVAASDNTRLSRAAVRATDAQARALSPKAGPKAAAVPSTSPKDDPSSPIIVLRGGFDTPSTGASPSAKDNPASPIGRTSPLAAAGPASISATLASPAQPVTSPSLKDDMALYPNVFSGMQLKSAAPAKPSPPEQAPPSLKDPAIAQPAGPQSPSMRRSRSPSPSRSNSKARAPPDSTNTVDKDHNGNNANAPRRPALDLDRDVSKQGKPDAGEDGRGRQVATSPSKTMQGVPKTAHAALSHTPGKNAPTPKKTTSAWLRLNGLSPSPPTIRSTLPLSAETEVVGAGSSATSTKGKAAAVEDGAAESPSVRPNGPKRHVSFKEPDEAQLHPHVPLELKHEFIEAEETPFELDEDMVSSSDDAEEPESEEAEDRRIAAVLVDASEKRISGSQSPSSASSSGAPRDTSLIGRTLNDTLSASVSNGKGAQSLAAMLNNPEGFIGSLRISSSIGLAARSPNKDTRGSPQERIRRMSSEIQRENEQSKRMRELLAMDAPSHRSRKSKSIAQILATEQEAEVTDKELDQLAPVSTLATSLPVAIGIPRFNRKEEYEFERKTSVPNDEKLLVPKFKNRNTGRPLPMLGEEDEGSVSPIPTPDREKGSSKALGMAEQPSSQVKAVDVPGAQKAALESMADAMSRTVEGHSPPVPKEMSTSAATDARIADSTAARADDDETGDEVAELNAGKSGFVPPHIWSRNKAGDVGLLGTSARNYT